MKKIFKALLLLSVLVFAINCQSKVADSTYEVVDENTQLSPDFVKPEDDEEDLVIPGGDGTTTMTALTIDELSITNANDFNRYINAGNASISDSQFIKFKIDSSRINEKIFLNTNQTQVVASIKIVERSKGSDLNKLIKGLKVIKYADGELNSYSIYMNNPILIEALPKVDTYAKIAVDVYVKDLRPGASDSSPEALTENAETPEIDLTKKQYAVTQRSFEFIIKRVAD